MYGTRRGPDQMCSATSIGNQHDRENKDRARSPPGPCSVPALCPLSSVARWFPLPAEWTASTHEMDFQRHRQPSAESGRDRERGEAPQPAIASPHQHRTACICVACACAPSAPSASAALRHLPRGCACREPRLGPRGRAARGTAHWFVMGRHATTHRETPRLRKGKGAARRTSRSPSITLLCAPLCTSVPSVLNSVVTRRHRFPRRSCSISRLSNSALKLPLPKLCEPRRQMISKKSVGRSCSGLVKSCRR